jgi:hypothetical protein
MINQIFFVTVTFLHFYNWDRLMWGDYYSVVTSNTYYTEI